MPKDLIGLLITNCGCQVAPPSDVRIRNPELCVTSPKRGITRYPSWALENAMPEASSLPTPYSHVQVLPPLDVLKMRPYSSRAKPWVAEVKSTWSMPRRLTSL